MPEFRISTDLLPRGDQPYAIEKLVEGVAHRQRFQTLLGVTGSGKTFTMAHVIAQVQRPALVIAHNKTLAAQLYGEFRDLFPRNAVEYFVSYYDYYQPEAYIPSTDTYIEKDTLVNDEIERLRHATTHALGTRSDVIVVASVSCIYGLGAARSYLQMGVTVHAGEKIDREALLRRLVDAQYQREEHDLQRGTFRVRGDTVDVFPAYEQERAIRVEFFGDTVERIAEIDPLRGGGQTEVEKAVILPGSHYVTDVRQREAAIESIRAELNNRVVELRDHDRLTEAQRLKYRTLHDVEMLEQFGFCPGIENYSRHLSDRAPGEPPPCLLDYFCPDFLVFIDESHQTLPQIASMYWGDRARKETLVEYGFRLPSALDNRPLKFSEFEELVPQAVFVSATPGDYELTKSGGVAVEQLVRPTGLLDPEVEIRPAKSQVDNLLDELRKRSGSDERVLVTCLTKRMAEDLSDYYADVGVRCRYLHSEIDTLQRVEIIRDLRRGLFDVLIGINLLREGLDIPEVSLVAILDADKEGFLRSRVSLIQTIGRAARNLHGKAILYADVITDSIRVAVDETNRRREVQRRYNEERGITPEGVRRNVLDLSAALWDAAPHALPLPARPEALLSSAEIGRLNAEYATRMREAAQALQFETAAEYRDLLLMLKDMDLGVVPPERSRLNVPREQEATPVASRRRAAPPRRSR